LQAASRSRLRPTRSRERLTYCKADADAGRVNAGGSEGGNFGGGNVGGGGGGGGGRKGGDGGGHGEGAAGGGGGGGGGAVVDAAPLAGSEGGGEDSLAATELAATDASSLSSLSEKLSFSLPRSAAASTRGEAVKELVSLRSLDDDLKRLALVVEDDWSSSFSSSKYFTKDPRNDAHRV
jgi:hypothetical protein